MKKPKSIFDSWKWRKVKHDLTASILDDEEKGLFVVLNVETGGTDFTVFIPLEIACKVADFIYRFARDLEDQDLRVWCHPDESPQEMLKRMSEKDL